MFENINCVGLITADEFNWPVVIVIALVGSLVVAVILAFWQMKKKYIDNDGREPEKKKRNKKHNK